MVLSPAGAADSETAESLFVRANQLFQKGLDSTGTERADDIRRAAVLYEQIVSEKGIRNGYLYYDLGNCYFHVGQIGRAILNYRRAEKLIPNYSDLKANLKSARSRRKDSIQETQMGSITRTLFFWHYIMGLRTKILVFGVLFSIIWILLLMKLFRETSLVKWGVVVCIVFALVIGGSAAVEFYADESIRPGVIVAEETIPRKGPGESYARSFKESLHEGTEFRVRERQAGWFQVELDSGEPCWLDSKDIGLI